MSLDSVCDSVPWVLIYRPYDQGWGVSSYSERVLWELIFPFAVEQQIDLKHINTQINCLDRYNDYPY